MQTPGSSESVPVPALKECNTIMALSQTEFSQFSASGSKVIRLVQDRLLLHGRLLGLML